jgi:hypothetical protein
MTYPEPKYQPPDRRPRHDYDTPLPTPDDPWQTELIKLLRDIKDQLRVIHSLLDRRL